MPALVISELHIIQHNVRHYINNKGLLHADWCEENPDVILLNSTCLNPKENHYISFKSNNSDYKVYNTPKSCNNGSAILVKKSINHYPVSTKDDQLLAITVRTNKGLVTLGTFYRRFCPQSSNFKIPYPAFHHLFNRSHPVFLIGDLNVKHKALGMNICNTVGDEFYENCLKSNNINYIGPDFNTYFDKGHKTKCDIILGNKATYEVNQYISQGKQLGSDHASIHFKISTQPIEVEITPRLNYAKADWKKFKESLSEYELPDLQGMHKNDFNIVVAELLSKIVSEKEKNIPSTKFKYVANIPKTSQLSADLINSIDKMEETLRLQTPAPNPIQRSVLNNLKKQYKESRNEDLAKHYADIAAEVDSARGTNNFWKKVNQTKGNYTHGNTIIKENGKEITDPEEVCKHFTEKWKPVWKSNPPSDNPKAIDVATEYDSWIEANQCLIDPYDTVDFNRLIAPSKKEMKDDIYRAQLLAPIDFDDVKYYVRQLKDKKAPGETGISNKIVKQLPNKFLHNLVKIYNAALSMGYFPDQFKSAITIMIPKKTKSKFNALNYRPIALLEAIGKLYEKIINKRLKWYLEDKNKLNDLQFGFRPTRSTHTSLTAMIEFITQAQKRGLDVFLLSKDIEKAFDKVHHPSLIHKIFTQFELPPLFCKTLANFLIDRTNKIKVNGHCSEAFTPEAGVPQGSVLGPLLYIMFINDAPKPQMEQQNGKNIYKSEFNSYFADDNVIMTAGYEDSLSCTTPTPNDLAFGNRKFRDMVQAASNWEDAHRIKTNADKSVIMMFSNSHPKGKYITLHPLEDSQPQTRIKHVSKHTILGVEFDSKLNFVSHIENIKNSVKCSINSLKPLWRTNVKTKNYLFKAIIQPKITYSYVIYHLLSLHQKRQLQKTQNIPIRKFVLGHLHWSDKPNAEACHVNLRLKSISQIAWERGKKFYKRLKEFNPTLYKMFCTYTELRTNTTKNTISRPSPLQFALGSRPVFIYDSSL